MLVYESESKKQGMGIINILHKCEYSHRNFLNASCFNVNSGSADVTHTFVFFSRLSLSESILTSVFALSSDNQGDSLTFAVVVLICLLGKGEVIWLLTSRCQKCYMYSEIWDRPQISWGLVFLVCHSPRHFLSIFWNCTADLFNELTLWVMMVSK